MENQITPAEMLKLKRWNTPTLYNGWEAITQQSNLSGFNREVTTDFMIPMGPMIGRAVTLKIEPSNPDHAQRGAEGWAEYYAYLAAIDGPKIVVVQDMDKPETIGSFWGEVNSNCHRALGCIGTITDGAIRDVDEMTNAGFKALARRLCVGHANSFPVQWNCEVTVFGTPVNPGQLIHADKHGFLAIPEEDEAALLDASIFLDNNECDTFLPFVRNSSGLSRKAILDGIDACRASYGKAYQEKFSGEGEW